LPSRERQRESISSSSVDSPPNLESRATEEPPTDDTPLEEAPSEQALPKEAPLECAPPKKASLECAPPIDTASEVHEEKAELAPSVASSIDTTHAKATTVYSAKYYSERKHR